MWRKKALVFKLINKLPVKGTNFFGVYRSLA